MRHEIVHGNIIPSDISAQVRKMCQLPANRAVEAHQERNYRVDCQNGDQIYIQERTQIRIYEVK